VSIFSTALAPVFFFQLPSSNEARYQEWIESKSGLVALDSSVTLSAVNAICHSLRSLTHLGCTPLLYDVPELVAHHVGPDGRLHHESGLKNAHMLTNNVDKCTFLDHIGLAQVVYRHRSDSLLDSLALIALVEIGSEHFHEHSQALARVHRPIAIGVVQVIGEENKTILSETAVVPARDHELPEIKLAITILVHDRKHPAGKGC